MGSNAYAGTAPVSALWVLDDSLGLRYYTSEKSLAKAICDGYGRTTHIPPQPRRPSLQHFSAHGVVDCSAFLDLPVPDRVPRLDETELANRISSSRPTPAWTGRLTAAKKASAADAKLLTQRLVDYRDALLAGTPPPSPNPWGDPTSPADTETENETHD